MELLDPSPESAESSKMATTKPFTFLNTVSELSYHDYGMYNTSDGRKRDILICDSDSAKTPLYLARMCLRMSKKGKPDVRLYSAQHVNMEPEVIADGTKLKSKQAKSGDIVGVAYFPAFSKKTQIGIGSPNTPDTIRWKVMNVPKIGVHEFAMSRSPCSAQYANMFSTSIGSEEVSPEGETRYQWRGTHTAVEGPDKTVEARRKLVNEQGEVVALFIPAGWKGLSVLGTLRIFKNQLGSTTNTVTGIDKDMEIQVILSRCAIVEKLRR